MMKNLSRESIEEILKDSSSYPDPEMALNKLMALSESINLAELFKDNNNFRDGFIRLLGSSNFLGNFLIKYPNIVEKMASSGFLTLHISKETHLSAIEIFIGDTRESAERRNLLRKYKYIEFLRITYLALNEYLSLKETTRELSNLADSLIGASMQQAIRELAAKSIQPPQAIRFSIVGLGKLGGLELNYSSDIDVMFIYDLPDKNESDIKEGSTYKDYYTRLTELTVKILSERTEHGFLYRVDLRLRPDGDKGPLCQPLVNMLRYYEYAGRTWERSIFSIRRPKKR